MPDASHLDAQRFAQATCDALFQAVLIDDEVDAHTELPDRMTLDYDPAQLLDCYRLCRQLWREGVDHAAFGALIDTLRRERDLGPEQRLAFKYARAKIKHLRFAWALYDERHRYPHVMDWMTTALGHLQDAFKNGDRAKVYREAVLCRFFLSAGPQALLAREIDRLRLTSGESFRAYMGRQAATLEAALRQPLMTGHQFHATRKILSRQVSFYDTLRTLQPSDEAFKMSRSLAALNGLMGNMHDDLVARRVAGEQDYHRDAFALPADIQERLVALVKLYAASGLVRLPAGAAAAG